MYFHAIMAELTIYGRDYMGYKPYLLLTTGLSQKKFANLCDK